MLFRKLRDLDVSALGLGCMGMSEFYGPGVQKNLELVRTVETLAADKGCTPAQLALAWLLAQGDEMVPIPGTKRVKTLEENIAALDVVLTPEDLERLEQAFPIGAAAGARYPAASQASVNR